MTIIRAHRLTSQEELSRRRVAQMRMDETVRPAVGVLGDDVAAHFASPKGAREAREGSQETTAMQRGTFSIWCKESCADTLLMHRFRPRRKAGFEGLVVECCAVWTLS